MVRICLVSLIDYCMATLFACTCGWYNGNQGFHDMARCWFATSAKMYLASVRRGNAIVLKSKT